MRIVLILMLVLVAFAAHAERKVYKCTNADGSLVFSPDPCGAGAQEMKVDTTATPTPAPANTEHAAPRGAPNAATTDVGAEDAKCWQDVERLKTYPSDANLQMMLQRQGELVRSYAANPADATKIQIGNLDAAIAAEQTRLSEERRRVDRAVTDALARCDASKAARDKASGGP